MQQSTHDTLVNTCDLKWLHFISFPRIMSYMHTIVFFFYYAFKHVSFLSPPQTAYSAHYSYRPPHEIPCVSPPPPPPTHLDLQLNQYGNEERHLKLPVIIAGIMDRYNSLNLLAVLKAFVSIRIAGLRYNFVAVNYNL